MINAQRYYMVIPCLYRTLIESLHEKLVPELFDAEKKPGSCVLFIEYIAESAREEVLSIPQLGSSADVPGFVLEQTFVTEVCTLDPRNKYAC